MTSRVQMWLHLRLTIVGALAGPLAGALAGAWKLQTELSKSFAHRN